MEFERRKSFSNTECHRRQGRLSVSVEHLMNVHQSVAVNASHHRSSIVSLEERRTSLDSELPSPVGSNSPMHSLKKSVAANLPRRKVSCFDVPQQHQPGTDPPHRSFSFLSQQSLHSRKTHTPLEEEIRSPSSTNLSVQLPQTAGSFRIPEKEKADVDLQTEPFWGTRSLGILVKPDAEFNTSKRSIAVQTVTVFDAADDAKARKMYVTEDLIYQSYSQRTETLEEEYNTKRQQMIQEMIDTEQRFEQSLLKEQTSTTALKKEVEELQHNSASERTLANNVREKLTRDNKNLNDQLARLESKNAELTQQLMQARRLNSLQENIIQKRSEERAEKAIREIEAKYAKTVIASSVKSISKAKVMTPAPPVEVSSSVPKDQSEPQAGRNEERKEENVSPENVALSPIVPNVPPQVEEASNQDQQQVASLLAFSGKKVNQSRPTSQSPSKAPKRPNTSGKGTSKQQRPIGTASETASEPLQRWLDQDGTGSFDTISNSRLSPISSEAAFSSFGVTKKKPGLNRQKKVSPSATSPILHPSTRRDSVGSSTVLDGASADFADEFDTASRPTAGKIGSPKQHQLPTANMQTVLSKLDPNEVSTAIIKQQVETEKSMVKMMERLQNLVTEFEESNIGVHSMNVEERIRAAMDELTLCYEHQIDGMKETAAKREVSIKNSCQQTVDRLESQLLMKGDLIRQLHHRIADLEKVITQKEAENNQITNGPALVEKIQKLHEALLRSGSSEARRQQIDSHGRQIPVCRICYQQLYADEIALQGHKMQ